METIMNALAQLGNYIDVMYLLTFMFLGYLVKQYLKEVLDSVFHKDIKFVYVLLIFSAIVAIPFLLTGAPWQKILVSYAFGTSLHETIFTYVEKRIKKALADGKDME